ncbi:MAG: hypothetical protein E7059_04220 [Treponema bryantii]|nr:hypothetical protein [Treponema bryantii]
MNMKQKCHFKQIILLFALGLFIFSCKNPLAQSQENQLSKETVKLKISTNLARTVLPTQFNAGTSGLTWTLTGIKDGTSTELGSWSDDYDVTTGAVREVAYLKMTSTEISVDVGTWVFTLDVTNGGKVLTGTTGSIDVSEDSTLTFVMQEPTGEGVAQGQIDFTLTFPARVVDNVVATLSKYGETNAEMDSQTFTPQTGEAGTYVKYIKTVDAGTYMLKLDLQQQDPAVATHGDYITINTYTCLIRVAPGLLSSGSYELTSLAKLYPVTFELNGGSLGENTTTYTVTYNKYQKIDLLEPSKPEFVFDGWYTNENCDEPVNLDENGKFSITEGITLYAKWAVVEEYILKKRDSSGTEIEFEESDASCTTAEVPYTEISVNNPNASDNTWTYYVFPQSNQKFTEAGNYEISVDLWAQNDTVVSVSAARADMYFTVKNEWKTYTFETGYVQDTNAGISFGIGMSEKTRIKNLTVKKLDETEKLPSLVFSISKEGVNSYLAQEEKPDNILDVEKTDSGYNININTMLTDEDNYNKQNVTLQLRKIVEEEGFYKASVNIQGTENSSFYVSPCADTNSNKSMAWNNTNTEVNNTVVSLESYFYNYAQNDELTMKIINSSAEVVTSKVTSFVLKDFNVEATSFEASGKQLVRKLNDETLEKINGKFYMGGVTLPNGVSEKFDFLMFDEYESDPNWDNVTRFLYVETTSDEPKNFEYHEGEDSSNPEYYIKNISGQEKSFLIMFSDFEIVIGDDPTFTPSVENITYFPGNEADGTAEYLGIYTAAGLNTYRDIINGTLTEDLTIHGDNYAQRTFNRETIFSINAKLMSDVQVSNWVPIGVYDSDTKTYFTFDGNGKTITVNDVNSTDPIYEGSTNDYAGLFGFVGNGTIDTGVIIKNLTVAGTISSSTAEYVGGIVACANGVTIENCVNNATVQGSNPDSNENYDFAVGGIVGYAEGSCNVINSVNNGVVSNTNNANYSGTAGIVGLVARYNVNIDNCINLGNITGQDNVAGLVGFFDSSTAYETQVFINKSINIGTIKAGGGVSAGISTVPTSYFNCTIKNCINMGNLGDSTVAGICYDINENVQVSNCINVGGKEEGVDRYLAIDVSQTEKNNNFYLSQESITNSGGTPKSADQLKTAAPFDDSWFTDNWFFVDGRYPLPDISQNIPPEVWAIVLEKANE